MTFASYPSLAGRAVLISGGATGIGAGIVEHFAEQKARVAFLDVDQKAGDALCDALAERGLDRPLFKACDLRDVDALKAAIAGFASQIGPFRVLVNNAARDDRHKVEDVSTAYFDDMVAVNLRHQFFAAQALAEGMAQAGGGSIINMGSISWLLGNPGYPVYATCKAAINGLTRSLARDLGPRNIRVNAVLPGWIMTQRQLDLWLTPEAEARLMEDQCLKEKLYPADVARMVLWLAADDSRLVTSQSFIVDGGAL